MTQIKREQKKNKKKRPDDQSVDLISPLDIMQTRVNDQRTSLNELIKCIPSSTWEP